MTQTKTSGALNPPLAVRKPETQSRHGVEWVDDYAWLRAPNWREVLRDPALVMVSMRRLRLCRTRIPW